MSTWGMQQLQMNELHQRISEQQDMQQQYQHEHETVLQIAQKSQRSMKEEMTKPEEHVSFKVEHLFPLHGQWNNQQYQHIQTAVVSNLEKVVQHGIAQTVLPGVKKSLEPLKEHIHQDMFEDLAATDSRLKDGIAKMVFSQQTIDAFAMVAGNAVSTSVQAAYSETFKNIIIPSFERATQALMHQVNNAFQNGKRELLKHLDRQLDEVRQNQLEARFPIVTELKQMTDSFQSSAERMLSHAQATIETNLKSELQSTLSGMQETIAHYLKDAVQEEVSMAVKELGDRISDNVLNEVRSGAVPTVQVTPNLQKPKSQILQLLQQGQMNTAFHEALCACNLEMVIFVCEKVNFSEVFEETPCPLQQDVLLSLIQQLSIDLESNTELKHRFIQGAMVNLDRSDPVLQLHQSLQTIMSTWGMQQLQMNELHQRISEQQDMQQRYQHEHETILQNAQKLQRSIKEEMTKHVERISLKVEHLLSQHAQWEDQQYQDLLKQTEAREELDQDLLYSIVTQTIQTAVVSNLEKVVQDEIRQTVLPVVEKSLKSVTEQIDQDVDETLAATDSLLKESIAKMVFSQETIDALEMGTRNAVSTSIQAAYSETFKNIIIPSFERATQALMHQVNNAFQNGKRELLKHLDTQLYQERRDQLEAFLPIVTELQKTTDAFHSSVERMPSHVQATIKTHLKSELQSSLSGMQETIAHYLKDAVREEVSMAVKELGDGISDSVLNAVRSGAVPTVQVTPNLQKPKPQILQLLQQGQMNTAFHVALCACNLEMVIFVCEKVNFSEVFEETPCPLQQDVLLSLIQQLSIDLGSNTELKNKFIQGAMVNLDRSDPVLQVHITSVICRLVENVDAFIEKHPRMIHQFKLLRLAAKALIR